MSSAQLDICFNRHGGNSESVAAHESIVPTKAQLRMQVFRTIEQQGSNGMTCEEVEQATGLSHQTVSARCSELKKRGLVLVAGRRATKSGRSAAVLVAAELGLDRWLEIATEGA